MPVSRRFGADLIWFVDRLLGGGLAGTQDTESVQKKGYKLPRSIVQMADMSRIIQSEEVQNVVRPPKVPQEVNRVKIRKANPLKNRKAMYKLNPLAVVMKDRATRKNVSTISDGSGFSNQH